MHMCRIYRNGADEPVSRAGMEMQTHSRAMWTQRPKSTVG